MLYHPLACDLEEVISVYAFVSSSVKWGQYPFTDLTGFIRSLMTFVNNFAYFLL